MDKIDKFTRRLERHEAMRLNAVICQIRVNQLFGLDLKKLKGNVQGCGVRIGRVRIRFLQLNGQNVITDIGFRNDNTY